VLGCFLITYLTASVDPVTTFSDMFVDDLMADVDGGAVDVEGDLEQPQHGHGVGGRGSGLRVARPQGLPGPSEERAPVRGGEAGQREVRDRFIGVAEGACERRDPLRLRRIRRGVG